MSEQSINSTIEIIRNCFETRDFAAMLDLFTIDGIYETPHALDETQSMSSGIEAIRERFSKVADSAWNKAVKIGHVQVKTMPAQEPDAVIVEFFISGIRKSDGVAFNFPSSVAIIRTKNGKIAHYRDFPNVLGINKAAGLLSQFAERLKD